MKIKQRRFSMNKEVKRKLRRFGYLEVEYVIANDGSYLFIKRNKKFLSPDGFIERLKTETDYDLYSPEYKRSLVYRKLFGGGLLSFADPLLKDNSEKLLSTFPKVADDKVIKEWYGNLISSLNKILKKETYNSA